MKKIWAKLGIIGLIMGGLLLAAAGYIWWSWQPVNINQPEQQRVVISRGKSVAEIGRLLQEKGLIKNSWTFKLYVQLKQAANQLQAGSFELSPSLSVAQLVAILSSGTDDMWVTLPEGLRREEIAATLAQYDLVEFSSADFLAATVGLEGQLFPDTYLVPKTMTTQGLVNLFTTNFNQKIKTQLADLLTASDRPLTEVLILASIVEREALGFEQMQQVAGVLNRRLEMGMPLQVDASLQYAVGYDETQQSWWSTPTSADKEVASPFNTYLNPGLPPSPICNPGQEAVKAVLTPVDQGYLFYLHDSQGQIHFARTLDEHNHNINQYLR